MHVLAALAELDSSCYDLTISSFHHMYCTNCGESLNEDAKFCDKCGSRVKPEHKREQLQEVSLEGANINGSSRASSARKSTLPLYYKVANWIASIVVLILLKLAVSEWSSGYNGVELWAAFLVALIAYSIGYYLPRSNVGKKLVAHITLMSWIAWINLVAWFLPPLGIATGLLSVGFADALGGTKRTRNILLGYVGLVLAILNAAAAISRV